MRRATESRLFSFIAYTNFDLRNFRLAGRFFLTAVLLFYVPTGCATAIVFRVPDPEGHKTKKPLESTIKR